MFIGHFALTPEPLVCLSWNVVLRILQTRGRSAPSDQKNVGHPEDSPLCKRPFSKERRRPDHPDDHLQQSVLLRPLDFGHPEDRPLCKWPFVKERRNNCCEEQLLRGTIVEGNNCSVEKLSQLLWGTLLQGTLNCREEQLSWGNLLWGTLLQGTLIYDGTGSK